MINEIDTLDEVYEIRLWAYQLCSEFGWYPTGDSSNHPFGKYPPIEYFEQRCEDLFGAEFGDIEQSKKNIENSNRKYGGLKPNVTNVYFTQGSRDPWQSIGISSNLNDHSPGFLIKGTFSMIF